MSDFGQKAKSLGLLALQMMTYSTAPPVAYAAAKANEDTLDGTSWDGGGVSKVNDFTLNVGETAMDVFGNVGNYIVPGSGTAISAQKDLIDGYIDDGDLSGLGMAVAETAAALSGSDAAGDLGKQALLAAEYIPGAPWRPPVAVLVPDTVVPFRVQEVDACIIAGLAGDRDAPVFQWLREVKAAQAVTIEVQPGVREYASNRIATIKAAKAAAPVS